MGLFIRFYRIVLKKHAKKANINNFITGAIAPANEIITQACEMIALREAVVAHTQQKVPALQHLTTTLKSTGRWF